MIFSKGGGWKLWACELAALPLRVIFWPFIWIHQAVGWVGGKIVG